MCIVFHKVTMLNTYIEFMIVHAASHQNVMGGQ